MNKVHKAYQTLGLEPGTPIEAVKRRYKRLVLVWHPDRMQNNEGRYEAEEELKRINHAFDTLKKHFECPHRTGATCDCQPDPAGSYQHGSTASGAQSGRTGSDAHQRDYEEDARQRHEERRRKAEEEARQAAAEQAARQQQAAADASTRATEEAVKQEQALREEKLRWRLAMAAGAVLVFMLAFGFIGVAAKSLINNIQHQLDNHHPQSTHATDSLPSSTTGTASTPATDDPDHPFIPLQYRFRGGNPASWRKFMDDDTRKQQQREEEQHKQDIYFTLLAIDRNQRLIDYCTTTIVQLEAKLADPNVSECDKDKLRSYRNYQQTNLENAQRELAEAKFKLKQLV